MLTDSQIRGTGICHYGFLSTQDIIFSEEIRKICESNTCRQYGQTWACPPAVGTVAQCRARCLSFERAMVFCADYPLDDAFDYEGMLRGHGDFKALCDRLYELLDAQGAPFLLLSNEGCARCAVCTYPESACRMPDQLFPSLEGFGIQVTRLAESAHVPYRASQNTVTYFGMMLGGPPMAASDDSRPRENYTHD